MDGVQDLQIVSPIRATLPSIAAADGRNEDKAGQEGARSGQRRSTSTTIYLPLFFVACDIGLRQREREARHEQLLHAKFESKQSEFGKSLGVRDFLL